MDPPTKEQNIQKDEPNEGSAEHINRNIEILQHWLKNEADFKGKSDVDYLSNWLKFKKNNVERVKEMMRTYYKLCKSYPNVMKNKDIRDERLSKILNQGCFMSDVCEDRQSPVIVIVKSCRVESGNDLYDCSRLIITCMETFIMESSRVREHGVIVVLDLANTSFDTMIRTTPNWLKITSQCLMGCLTVKFIALCIINASLLFSTAISIGTLFVPSHHQNKIHFSSGIETMLELIPPEYLPDEYGGSDGAFDRHQENVRQVLLEYRDKMVDDDKYGYVDNDQNDDLD